MLGKGGKEGGRVRSLLVNLALLLPACFCRRGGRRKKDVPDVKRRVLDHAHGILQLHGRDVEAPSNMLGHAQRHVRLGEAGEEFPHLQDSQSTPSKDLACKVELLKGLRVHFDEGLGLKGEGGEDEGRRIKYVVGHKMIAHWARLCRNQARLEEKVGLNLKESGQAKSFPS